MSRIILKNNMRIKDGSYIFASKIILLLVCVLCFVLAFVEIPYHLDSMYDEGFLYASLQQAFSGHIDGDTQYNNIISSLFGPNLCSSIIALRYISFASVLVTLVLFIFITFNSQETKKNNLVEYIIISSVFIIPSLGGYIINYNRLAELFLCLMIALGYVLLIKKNQWSPLVCLVLGSISVFAIFTLLPSAVLLLGCLFMMVLIRYWGETKTIIYMVGSVLLGVLMGLVIVHLCVVDLGAVWSAMMHTAQTISSLDRGYDPFSLFSKCVLFVRDWVLCGLVVTGIVYLTQVVKKWNKCVGGLLFIVLSLVYYVYQVKPVLTLPMMLTILWLPLFINKWSAEKINPNNSFDFILDLFLAFAPLIMSIGTNTYLGSKMRFMLLPWALLVWRLMYKKEYEFFRLDIVVLVTILLLSSYKNLYHEIKSDKNICTYGPVKGMHLTDKQYEHFENCRSIMVQYGFTSQQSVVFGPQAVMTTCYLEGVNSSTDSDITFWVNSVHDDDKRPDFIFLQPWEEQVGGELLRNKGWGWPEEFDRFDVGSPESIPESVLPSARFLYCRKKKY